MEIFLASRQQHIHLTMGRVRGDLGRFGDEVIGGIALGGDHHDNIVAGVARIHDDARHVEDAVAVFYR